MTGDPENVSKDDSERMRGLLEKAKSGDQEAFSYIYKAYFAPLYRYVYYRVRDMPETEDIVQDVFLKAYAALSRYSHAGASPLAYFYTIARNAIIDRARKKQPASLDDDDVAMNIADAADGPQDHAMRQESAQAIAAALRLLPDDQRDVITLRFLQDMSTKETAEMLGKSQEAVRQLQSRALRSLKGSIKNASNEPQK